MSCQRLLPDILPPGDEILTTHHLRLDPVPRLVAQARRFVLDHAPDLPADVEDALVLLTSELVTNAVLHARTPIELGLTVAETSVLVTVHDLDLARSEQQPYAGREGGWGLGLVRSLAQESALVAGQAGSARTIFAAQFLAEGVRLGQPGVFVTLEEPADDLRANLGTLGWDVPGWEAVGDWRFVDASPLVRHGAVSAPASYSVETLAALIGHAVDVTGAERIVIDSLNGVLALHQDGGTARQELRTLISSLRAMGLTIVLTVETPGDPGGTLSRYGVEEFVADTVVLLRNVREGPFRRRTVEVLKMRGAMHHKGDVGFTVLPGRGLVVLPVTAPQAPGGLDDTRVSTGNAGLDELMHGGVFRGSSTLLSGPSGTGKTLLTTQFAADGLARGERVLLMAYEETREQIRRNGATFGHDVAGYEQQGLLQIVSHYPEVASLDDHLVEIRQLVATTRPARLAIDSLSALERIGSAAAYREFVIGATSYVKTRARLPADGGLTSPGGRHIGHREPHLRTDRLGRGLRHVETRSTLRRGVLVLKMRGSSHDHTIRELVIGQGRSGWASRSRPSAASCSATRTTPPRLSRSAGSGRPGPPTRARPPARARSS